jgi:hypothetical protein
MKRIPSNRGAKLAPDVAGAALRLRVLPSSCLDGGDDDTCSGQQERKPPM